jgi:hypothetical protein
MQQESTKPPNSGGKQVARGVMYATAILALLWFFVLAPRYQDVQRARANSFEMDSVRAAGIALIQYTADHSDRYPNLSGDMVSTLRPYIKDPKVVEAMSRFVWNGKLSGKTHQDLDDPEKMWVLYSKISWSGMYVVGSADGHVRKTSPANLPETIAKGDDMLAGSQRQ